MKSIFLRVLLLAFSVYIVISLTNLQVQLIDRNRELSEKLDELDELNIKIEEAMHLLDSGSEAELVEKTARERLGFYYPDEEVYTDISGK